MSRGSAAVRFPDGTVKFCLYNGTCDVLQPGLFETMREPWDIWFSRSAVSDLWPEPVGEVEDVVIYSDYGGGFYWPGKATRNRVIGPLDWDGFCDIEQEGKPDWWLKAVSEDED